MVALLFAGCTGNIEGTPPPIVEPSPTPSPSPSLPPVDCATDAQPGSRLLRRLTGAEYDRAVQDTLHIESVHGERFPADTVVDGFDNHARALTVSPLLADQLLAAAEDVAFRAVDGGLCNPIDRACAGRVVRESGRRMFRRPLTAAEVTRYEALFDSQGLEAVVTALLMSPHFLYRAEIGAAAGGVRYPLTGYEIATELSFAITGSTPDDALLDAALAGELDTTDGIATHARHLFASPRARQVSRAFVGSWLALDRLTTVPKDTQTFPELTSQVRASMRGGADRFIDHALHEEGTLEALLLSNTTYIDANLALLFGEDIPRMGFDLEGFASHVDPLRKGIIAQPSFLTTHARPNASSPVHRGVTIRRHMLCQPLPPPPPGVNAEPPAVDPMLTGRERYAAHSASPACQGCHRRIDEVGFGLERFDGIGRYRYMEAGRVIDVHGTVESIDGMNIAFDGAGELADMLARSTEVRACFTALWATYAWGLGAKTELGGQLQRVKRAIDPMAPLSIEDLVVAVATSGHFRERTGPRADPENPGTEPPPPPPPPPMPGLAIDEHLDSSWETGSCKTITVTNRGPDAVDWVITTAVEGVISQAWNANRSGDSGMVEWRGVSWNASLAPGANASFGYCAAK